jgi:hypothetical protein
LNTTSAPVEAILSTVARESRWSSGWYSSPTIVPPLAVTTSVTRVEHARPDVVGGRQIEGPRPRLSHQPRDERVDLLGGHRAGAEDERVGLLPLVLLGVDVERLALDHGRLLDGLPRGAVDAAEDDVDLIALDELLRLGGRDRVVGRAVLEMQLDVAPQQAALRIDVADDHPGHVGVREPDERQRAALVGDDSHLDGIAGMDG